MRRAMTVMSATLLAACAATYAPPKITPVDVTRSSSASRSDLLRAARQVLASEGFQIASADEASGVVSTLPRRMRVTPDQADCGTNIGVENAYLRDGRTQTSLAVNVIAADRRLTVRASVDAFYAPGGSVMQPVTLQCVSKGAIESELAAKILNAT